MDKKLLVENLLSTIGVYAQIGKKNGFQNNAMQSGIYELVKSYAFNFSIKSYNVKSISPYAFFGFTTIFYTLIYTSP